MSHPVTPRTNRSSTVSRSQTPLLNTSKRPAIRDSTAPRAQSSLGHYRSNSYTPKLTPTPSSFLKPFNASKIPGSANIKVVVRVRPFLPREVEKNATNLIQMDQKLNTTTILPPPPQSPTLGPQSSTRARRVYEPKTFTFDHSFYSVDPASKDFADQDIIYEKVGDEFLDHNFEGYHTCIFAYGQTGSGKSYTMMGDSKNPGIIPRTCSNLFERIDSMTSADVQCTVRVSYFEIYNEQVRDLLVSPSKDGSQTHLKVRESPTEGPYVEDLSEFSVKSQTEVLKYIEMGNKHRVVASTKMNDVSSRSHAVFTLIVKQVITDPQTDATEEKTARIRLVDLAGSERANATGATGQRLREGSNINKSLTTLGRVIASLADDSLKDEHSGHSTVVPYRDSVLTWLLKDSLGGNSKTAMVACISPTDYEETLSTLRYANQAKSIKTRAIVNHDIVSAADRDKLLAQMQETINNLQLSLLKSTAESKNDLHVDAEKLKADEQARQQELEQFKNAIRFYEDKATTEETKRRAVQSDNEATKRHNRLLIDYLKEVTNKAVGSQYVVSDDDDVEVADEADNENDMDTRNIGDRSADAIRGPTVFKHQVTYDELQDEHDDIMSEIHSFINKVNDDFAYYRNQLSTVQV